jgi:hypothetical protein
MKKIFIVTILMVLSASAFSQKSFVSFQYSMGFGTGNLHDFIGQASFRGFTFDYRNMVQPSVGVGLDMGWNVFYEEKPDAVYQYKDLTYSGKQWRYGNYFPMLVAADYYFKPDADIVPYAGFGLGTMYSRQNTDMATYTFEKDAWSFAIRPEVGLVFKAGQGVHFNVVGKYYYGLKAGDLPAQGYFTLNVGFVFVN